MYCEHPSFLLSPKESLWDNLSLSQTYPIFISSLSRLHPIYHVPLTLVPVTCAEGTPSPQTVVSLIEAVPVKHDSRGVIIIKKPHFKKLNIIL